MLLRPRRKGAENWPNNITRAPWGKDGPPAHPPHRPPRIPPPTHNPHPPHPRRLRELLIKFDKGLADDKYLAKNIATKINPQELIKDEACDL